MFPCLATPRAQAFGGSITHPRTAQTYLLGCLVKEFLHLGHLGHSCGNGGPGGLHGGIRLEGEQHPGSGELLLYPYGSEWTEEGTLFYLIWKHLLCLFGTQIHPTRPS